MKFTLLSIVNFSIIVFFGGHSEEVPPVPIPNTEVKLFSADGTARATVWESRSSPYFIKQKPQQISAGAFVVLHTPRPTPSFPKSSIR